MSTAAAEVAELPSVQAAASLCAILRSGGSTPSGAQDAARTIALARAAADHGVAPLVFETLRAREKPTPAERALADALETLARTEAAVDAIRVAACREVLDALAGAGIETLVFKGSALAHSHYPRSDLRPRDDIDLLVREVDRARAGETLAALGFARAPSAGGQFSSYQELHARTDSRGIRHNVDLHWRVSNRQRYAAALGVDELLARALELPALGPGARCPDAIDAVLIASFHRAAHRGTQRLVWLYDLHLLMVALVGGDAVRVEELVERARLRGLARECAESLSLARRAFATPLSAAVEPLVAEHGGAALDGPAAMRAPRTVDIWVADLAALPGWRSRLALLRDHAFPPPEYMLERAHVQSHMWLPLLYATRALRGLPGLFRRD